MKNNSSPKPTRRWDLPRITGRKGSSELSSAEMFVGSFVLLILIGTLGFFVLPGLYTGPKLSFVDALFTSTSAICVTGLIVVDTATYFTFWGQLYILVLIQLGGLGMLTFASMIIAAMGGRPSLKAEEAIEGSKRTLPNVPAKKLILDIVKFTIICESIGAICLYCLWAPKLGWIEAIWPSIFHSISAFCNAGFSTNTDSLMSHANSTATLMVIAILILTGGIGFITLEELSLHWKKGRKPLKRISTHTKLVLVGTAVLTFVPAFWFVFFEWNHSFAQLSLFDKIGNSVFLSVTPRTAGYNAIDYRYATDSTNLLTMLLMMIGGSPGSTAGGMKVTTFMLMILLAWSKFRGRSSVIFFDRSIPEKTVEQATGLFVIMVTITIMGVFGLHVFDPKLSFENPFLVRVFEVISAINTVGLSIGVTPQLSAGSKLLLVIIMVIGRVGPLALAAAFEARFVKRMDYRLASEDVLIG
jgi:trk system potassium uptake protein